MLINELKMRLELITYDGYLLAQTISLLNPDLFITIVKSYQFVEMPGGPF